MDHEWESLGEAEEEGLIRWRCVRCGGVRSKWLKDGAPPSGSWALVGSRYVRCGEDVVAEVLES